MQSGLHTHKEMRTMDDLIRITMLNDYVFCPASIYFHNLYGGRDTLTFQGKAQLDGKKAHETVDNESYLKNRKILSGIDVFSEKYGLIGEIDIYDEKKRCLIERKKKIKQIYDGYIFQLYAQFFCMKEMGYPVDALFLYSMDDNKRYNVPLPLENPQMMNKFEEVIMKMRTTGIETYQQENPMKCKMCIYFEACDRGYKDDESK